MGESYLAFAMPGDNHLGVEENVSREQATGPSFDSASADPRSSVSSENNYETQFRPLYHFRQFAPPPRR